MVKQKPKDYREIVIKLFKLLIYQIEIEADRVIEESGKASFRISALSKVVEILENMVEPLLSVDQLKDVKGVGKGTMKRIQEIIDTGNLEELYIDPEEQKFTRYVDELEKIPDIGRKTAMKLVKKYNVKSAKELRKRFESGEIPLPDNIVKSLKYHGQVEGKIPHNSIQNVETYLQNKLMDIDIRLFGRICGSYRRKKPFSNDLDFIVIHPDIKKKKDLQNNPYFRKYLALLVADGFIVDNITGYDVVTKFMGLYRWSKESDRLRHIDIRFMPWDSYYSAILYFTGSGTFNTRMRNLAKKKGYLLNEYGIFEKNTGNMIKVKSEKEIFDILGMKYLQPELRK